jgi:hypothetical protein
MTVCAFGAAVLQLQLKPRAWQGPRGLMTHCVMPVSTLMLQCAALKAATLHMPVGLVTKHATYWNFVIRTRKLRPFNPQCGAN